MNFRQTDEGRTNRHSWFLRSVHGNRTVCDFHTTLLDKVVINITYNTNKFNCIRRDKLATEPPEQQCWWRLHSGLIRRGLLCKLGWFALFIVALIGGLPPGGRRGKGYRGRKRRNRQWEVLNQIFSNNQIKILKTPSAVIRLKHSLKIKGILEGRGV